MLLGSRFYFEIHNVGFVASVCHGSVSLLFTITETIKFIQRITILCICCISASSSTTDILIFMPNCLHTWMFIHYFKHCSRKLVSKPISVYCSEERLVDIWLTFSFSECEEHLICINLNIFLLPLLLFPFT